MTRLLAWFRWYLLGHRHEWERGYHHMWSRLSAATGNVPPYELPSPVPDDPFSRGMHAAWLDFIAGHRTRWEGRGA